MTGERGEALTEMLAAVLDEHAMTSGFNETGDYWKYACRCSWTGDSDAAHHAHIAAIQAAALAAHVEAAEAEAEERRQRIAVAALIATGRHSHESARDALISAAERLREFDARAAAQERDTRREVTP